MYGRVTVAVGVTSSGCMYSLYYFEDVSVARTSHGQPKGLKMAFVVRHFDPDYRVIISSETFITHHTHH